MKPVAIPINVLADDLTGAAEVAGILRRFGCTPRLIRSPDQVAGELSCVIDTDSRLLPPVSAAGRVSESLQGMSGPRLLFKKIDSLFRGPIGAEIDAALDATGRSTAIVLAQNPSRGRCVAGGRYTVDGVPIDQTPFRHDPEYPRHTAKVMDYVRSDRRRVVGREPGDPVIPGAINIASAATLEEVDGWVRSLDPALLPVGAADFMTRILRATGRVERADPPVPFGVPRLVVAGSASAYARSLPELTRLRQIPSVPMCEDAEWVSRVAGAVRSNAITLMHVGRAVVADLAAAERIQSEIARCVAGVVREFGVADLLVDGGATASAVIRALGLRDLVVVREVAPGVVTLESPAAPRLTIKPGSYPWPDTVWTA